ncbi:MAG: hypothetical protein F6J86_10920 [Symploca sp. SIO1B1]|nr:hypothetical protein [Symploca sp. SIO2D2]NER23638.1 hypothetical protein [Symploca sp. SIO1C2]NER94335.1 hypothetical protein [Symploca sp. SIO1B1]
MKQPLLKQSQPNLLENRCPSCLFMQLEGVLVQPDQIDLYLTINFDIQCESLPQGKMAFGLKGGKLQLRLENGKIHHQFRELTGLLTLVPQKEGQQLVTCQVRTKGSQKNPAWDFAVGPEQPVLQGLLQKTKLATLDAIAFPCSVEATFDVSVQNIYLTEVEGLWPANLSTNQLVILERGIAQVLSKRKLKPYLSRIELQFDNKE